MQCTCACAEIDVAGLHFLEGLLAELHDAGLHLALANPTQQVGPPACQQDLTCLPSLVLWRGGGGGGACRPTGRLQRTCGIPMARLPGAGGAAVAALAAAGEARRGEHLRQHARPSPARTHDDDAGCLAIGAEQSCPAPSPCQPHLVCPLAVSSHRFVGRRDPRPLGGGL